MELRYRTVEDQKQWPGLEPKQDFANGRRSKPIFKKWKCSTQKTR